MNDRMVNSMTEQAQTRRIDDLGRVVIPKAWRQYLGINEGDELRLSLSGTAISVSRSDASEQVSVDKARYEALERLYNAAKQLREPARYGVNSDIYFELREDMDDAIDSLERMEATTG